MSTYKERAEEIIRDFGDSNEIERLDAGVLSDEELDSIVSDAIFGGVLDLNLPIRKRWKKEDIQRRAMRNGNATKADEVHFEMDENPTLSSEQWARLKQVRAAAPPEATIKAFWVIAFCGRYEQRAPAASITVLVGDRVRRLDVYLDPHPESDHDEAREALGME